MSGENKQTILIINDVEGTRRSIESMLISDGYAVETASGEREAANAARIESPDLMLISLDSGTAEIVAIVQQIRRRANLSADVPAIVFCADEFAENEFDFGDNIFLSCPDNFNQLRLFISRLLKQFQKAAKD